MQRVPIGALLLEGLVLGVIPDGVCFEAHHVSELRQVVALSNDVRAHRSGLLGLVDVGEVDLG